MVKLRSEVERVLNICPNMSVSEIWLALQKKYPYPAIERVVQEIIDEHIEKLRCIEATIKIVDETGKEVSLEEYTNAKKQEKEG